MSRTKDFIADMQDDILDGLMNFEEIAMKWNCPVSWVKRAEELLDRPLIECEDENEYI